MAGLLLVGIVDWCQVTPESKEYVTTALVLIDEIAHSLLLVPPIIILPFGA